MQIVDGLLVVDMVYWHGNPPWNWIELGARIDQNSDPSDLPAGRRKERVVGENVAGDAM